MIKLRCVQAPHKGGLFTVGKVYKATLKAEKKIDIVKGNGKLLMASYHLHTSQPKSDSKLMLRDIKCQGYMFRMIGIE